MTTTISQDELLTDGVDPSLHGCNASSAMSSALLSLGIKAAHLAPTMSELSGSNPTDASNLRGMPEQIGFIAPAWSRSTHVAAAHIRQGNLEVMQWIAFMAMVMDHLGFFMTRWGMPEEPLLRGIGRLAFPMFSFVFAWRLANTLWRDPRHDFSGMLFHLVLCAFASHLAWAATGADTLVNVVAGYTAELLIVLLLQEDREWLVPLGLRLVLATVIGYWVSLYVDYGLPGLVLTLATYSYLRFNDAGARNTSLASLLVISAAFYLHTAFLALAIVYIIHNSKLSLRKRYSGIFYLLYPLHIFIFAVLTYTWFA